MSNQATEPNKSSMLQYSFVTIWRFEAPIEAVWNAIYHSEHWPEWWDYVEKVVEIEPGNEQGINSIRRYTWRTRLPYKITFDTRTTKVEPPFILEGVATGELTGRGNWHLAAEDSITIVRYEWNVRTDKRWMNFLAPIARPFFKWNHDQVMNNGGKGLAKWLGTKLIQDTA